MVKQSWVRGWPEVSVGCCCLETAGMWCVSVLQDLAPQSCVLSEWVRVGGMEMAVSVCLLRDRPSHPWHHAQRDWWIVSYTLRMTAGYFHSADQTPTPRQALWGQIFNKLQTPTCRMNHDSERVQAQPMLFSPLHSSVFKNKKPLTSLFIIILQI